MVEKLKDAVLARTGTLYPVIALGVLVSPPFKKGLGSNHRCGKSSFQRAKKGMSSPHKRPRHSCHSASLPKMALTKIALGLIGIQTGVGYRKGRDERMGTPAGPTAEPKNQDLDVTVILEVFGVRTPAVKILAPRTGPMLKKSGKIQRISLAVVLFGDQTV